MKQKRAQVYMTNRAYIDVLTEVRAHPYVETGGLFVAARRENNYYLIEATNSGINARYLYARFDRDYARICCCFSGTGIRTDAWNSPGATGLRMMSLRGSITEISVAS